MCLLAAENLLIKFNRRLGQCVYVLTVNHMLLLVASSLSFMQRSVQFYRSHFFPLTVSLNSKFIMRLNFIFALILCVLNINQEFLGNTVINNTIICAYIKQHFSDFTSCNIKSHTKLAQLLNKLTTMQSVILCHLSRIDFSTLCQCFV